MRVRWIALALLILAAVQAVPSFAQIVNMSREYRIHKVDLMRSRIEVTDIDREDPVLFVLVDGYTQVENGSRKMRWTELQPGNLILVKGGMTLDLKLKARTIVVHPTAASAPPQTGPQQAPQQNYQPYQPSQGVIVRPPQ